MKSYFGEKLKITVKGGSDESALIVSIKGFPSDFRPDMIQLQSFISGKSFLSSSAKDADTLVRLDDGMTDEMVFEIRNNNTKKLNYDPVRGIPCPAKAEDSPAASKGLMNVPIRLAGGLAIQILEERDIDITAEPAEKAAVALDILDSLLAAESPEQDADGDNNAIAKNKSSLSALRREIDETDEALLKSFERRMEISRQVASTKRALGLPVDNPQREAEILEDISSKVSPAFAQYAPEFFRSLFEMSKDYQRTCMSKEVFGLIGHPLGHSFSREVHDALGEYTFSLFDLNEEEMISFVSSRKFAGLTVTRPYKQAVIPLCDKLTPLAEKIGSVNTLYFDGDQLVGHNTDYDGFLYTAERSDISFKGKAVLILGTGGTSQTVAHACADEGALAVCFATRGNGDGNFVVNYEDLPVIADQIDVVINTTPVGTYPDNLNSIIDLRQFTACTAVIDVVYNPFRTALLMQAEELGMKTANGMPMIAAQAMAAAGRFLDKPGAFINRTEAVLKHLEGQTKNIILIGMPGSGKTTAAKKLALQTGRNFVDLDDEIVRASGMTIPEIFNKYGEDVFRKMETAVAQRIGSEHGQIIATGGGIVLSHDNYLALKQNGTFIWLVRPVEELPLNGRPLSSDLAALKKIAETRYPLYKSWSDYTMNSKDFLNL